MQSLKEQLGTDPERRKAIIVDACRLLDAEVADKSGLTGIAIKGAYSVVKGVKPGFIEEAVEGLMDEFMGALDPLYQEAVARGVKPSAHLQSEKSRVAEALLAITDKRAERTKYTAVKSLYGRLRGTAKGHVESAAPRLGKLIEQHATN